jgi:SHS2 domain-containing protein
LPTEFRHSSFSEGRFITTAAGYEINEHNTEFIQEIKAVTFHGLNVWKKEGEWIASIIFDV